MGTRHYLETCVCVRAGRLIVTSLYTRKLKILTLEYTFNSTSLRVCVCSQFNFCGNQQHTELDAEKGSALMPTALSPVGIIILKLDYWGTRAGVSAQLRRRKK